MYPLFFHFDAVNVNWNVTHEHSSARAQASIHLFYDLAEINFVRSHHTAHTASVDSIQGSVFMILFLFSPCSYICTLYAIEFSKKENDCEKRKRRINSHAHTKSSMHVVKRNMCVGHIHAVRFTLMTFSCLVFSTWALHLCCSLTRLFAIRSTEILSKYDVCICDSWGWGAFSSAVFKRRECQSKSNGGEISGWDTRDDYGNKMTTSDTMKWQNNLRSHEVRSEFNNSFPLVAHFVSLLLLSCLTSSTAYLTFCQCYHFLRYACFSFRAYFCFTVFCRQICCMCCYVFYSCRMYSGLCAHWQWRRRRRLQT